MAHPVVTAVKRLGIDAIELPHGAGQIGLGCFHEQVEVVAHQAVGMQHEMKPGDDTLQHTREPPPILVVEEDVLAGIASNRNMVERPRILKAQRSGHAAESTPSICTVQDLTPLVCDPTIISMLPLSWICIRAGSSAGP